MLKRLSVGLVLLSLLDVRAACALPSDAENIRAMQALALQSCAQSDVETGLRTFRSAIQLAEKTYGKDSTFVSNLYYEAGVAALRTSKYGEAENLLSKAVAVNPNAEEARLTLADYYRAHGRYVSAKKQIEQVLDHDPHNIQAQGILAATYQKEGSLAKAFQQFGRLRLLANMQNSYEAPPPADATAAASSGTSSSASVLNVRHLPAPVPKPKEPTEPVSAVQKSEPAEKITPVPEKAKPLPEKIKPVEEKSNKKMPKTKPEKQKHGKHEKKQPGLSDEEVSIAGQARLHSKVKLLTPIKAKHTQAEDSTAEAPPSEASEVQKKHASRSAVSRAPRVPRGMVPPPPAVPTTMPVYMPAPKPVPPAAVQPPQPVAPKGPVLKADTPKVDAASERSATSSSSAGSSSSGPEDDADFLIDWAGKKKKKK